MLTNDKENLIDSNLNGTTIDQNQLDHYNKVFEDWWSDPNNPLRLMNLVRIPTLIKGLINAGVITKEQAESDKPLKGLKILDAGCGAGVFSEPLAELGGEVIGLDISNEMIKYAQRQSEKNPNVKNNLQYVCETIENFCKVNSEQFDLVVTSETVEHVNNIDLYLKSCVECIKPNGTIYITTINRTMKSWLIAIILYEYIIKTIPKGTHEWNKFITPHELENYLVKNNCEKILYGGWYLSLLTKKYYLYNDTSVFYYMFAIKK